MADTSTPVLVGAFTIGGVIVGFIGSVIRDVMQIRQEKRKRRAEKFEEMVRAVYEFDHWMDRRRSAALGGTEFPTEVSPFSRLHAISTVYFPQFDPLILQLDLATQKYEFWFQGVAVERIAKTLELVDGFPPGYPEVLHPFMKVKGELLDALKALAAIEFQPASKRVRAIFAIRKWFSRAMGRRQGA